MPSTEVRHWEAGVEIYYSGDFDPEGLAIAERVLRRNQHQIFPWHMTLEAYEHTLSDKVVSEERLKKLDGVKDERLLSICDAMRKAKRSGCQERLVEQLIEDVRFSQ